jgi:ribosomal protein S18 acetylase RimI-like enzyme
MAAPDKADAVTALDLKPASTLTCQELADLANLAFTGYIGTQFNHTAESLEPWLKAHYVDLEQSYIFFARDEPEAGPVGFALIALRTEENAGRGAKAGHARLSGMAVIPAFQGRRVGGLALKMVINDVREKGIEVLELECICNNIRGVKLYQNAGFEIVQELLGWTRDEQVKVAARQKEEEGEQPPNNEQRKEEATAVKEQLQECTVEEVRGLVNEYGAEDLPWQPWGFHQSLTPQEAFHINSQAYCVIAEPSEGEEAYRISCVFVKPEFRGKGVAKDLAKAVFAKFPERKFTAKVIFPKKYGERLAEELGFKEQIMRQYQMRLRVQ